MMKSFQSQQQLVKAICAYRPWHKPLVNIPVLVCDTVVLRQILFITGVHKVHEWNSLYKYTFATAWIMSPKTEELQTKYTDTVI